MFSLCLCSDVPLFCELQCKFVSIHSLSSSPMVYNFFSFHLFICLFSCIGERFSDASFSLLFMLSCFQSFSTSLHCLLFAIVSYFRVLFLLHHWFIFFFFVSLIYLFSCIDEGHQLHCLLFGFLLCRICSIVAAAIAIAALGFRVLIFF